MKKLIFAVFLALAVVSTVQAQKLVIGEKAPEIRVKQWLSPNPADMNKACLVEFYHSSSQQCRNQLGVIDGYADKYGSKLTVLVITKEPAEKVAAIIYEDGRNYHAGIDEGKTFENFGVQFVPFCVLIDKRGRVVWFGNSTSLTEATLQGAF